MNDNSERPADPDMRENAEDDQDMKVDNNEADKDTEPPMEGADPGATPTTTTAAKHHFDEVQRDNKRLKTPRKNPPRPHGPRAEAERGVSIFLDDLMTRMATQTGQEKSPTMATAQVLEASRSRVLSRERE